MNKEEKVTTAVEELANFLDNNGFRGDDTYPEISLGEYGLLWNPGSGIAVSTYPSYAWTENDNFTVDEIPRFGFQRIPKETVRNQLRIIDSGFYDFIGSNEQDEIERFDEYPSPYYIRSLNQYNGSFDLYSRMIYTAKEIKKRIES